MIAHEKKIFCNIKLPICDHQKGFNRLLSEIKKTKHLCLDHQIMRQLFLNDPEIIISLSQYNKVVGLKFKKNKTPTILSQRNKTVLFHKVYRKVPVHCAILALSYTKGDIDGKKRVEMSHNETAATIYIKPTNQNMT